MNRVFALEVTKGHLKWRVSELARQSKVSRPLIYYYLGKSKAEILNYCLKSVAYDFYGLRSYPGTGVLTRSRERSDFFEGLLVAQKLLAECPSITLFYLKYRSVEPLKTQFLEIEAAYQKKLRRLFPNLSSAQIIALHSLLHGAVSAPFATPESIIIAIEKLKKCAAN